tara:strand:- start:1864 stop:2637 length:774 start_codon:yes stop_codon:yes gene_type:complete
MKICVLIKQVPDKDTSYKINDDNLTINTDDVSFVTNESDNYALEEALQIKEKTNGEVIVCTFGSESSQQVLKDALSKGADRAIHVLSEGFGEVDILSIAKILSDVLIKENFDLILSGLQSDDSGNGQLGILLSEFLSFTHASLVMETNTDNSGIIKVKRELENGWFQWSDLELPASITIQSGINTPRYASLMGIMAMKKKPIDILDKEHITININPKIKNNKIYFPTKDKQTKFIEGDVDSITSQLIDVLKNDVKVL